MKRAKSTIGLEGLCYAMLTSDDTDGHSYGSVKKLPGSINATLSPNAEETNQYADNGTVEVYSSIGDMEISLEVTGLPSEVLMDWMGYRKDANGVIIKDKDAQGDYFALGFRSLMANNKNKLVWAYKCKASPPEEAFGTIEGTSVTYQTRTTTLAMMPREHDGKWQAYVDENEDGVNATAISTFHDDVYEETPATPPTP